MPLKIVRPYTIKGNLLCFLIKVLCLPVDLFYGKKWRRAVEFEENPRTMSFKDIVHFAFKYYYRSPLLPSDSALDGHFIGQFTPGKIENNDLTISIGGDLMPYEMIKAQYTANLWDDVGEGFFGSDIVFANLETPIDTGKKPRFVPEVMLSDMHFNTNEATFNVFSGKGRFKGFDVLSIANNHTMDMGEEGIDATIGFLKNKGIDCVGAKLREVDPDFVIKEVNGIKVGFIAFTYSLNQFLPPKGKHWKVNYSPLNLNECPIDEVKRQSDACRNAGADFIICSLHCGNAYQVYPSRQSVSLFQRIFEECGVDVIAGGHPHNLQPWRHYDFKDPVTGKGKRGFAIYSLGDFIAYDIYTWCHLCAFVKLGLKRLEDGSIACNVIVHPMVMRRENKHLKLVYADEVFKSDVSDTELKDIKILYDICKSSETI